MFGTRRTSDIKATAPKGLYYGWVVVAAAFFIAFVSIGSRGAFGAFVNPMRTEFGWSFGLISLAATIGMLANGFFQPFAGWFYDKLGGRKVILTGLAILGGCTLLLSLTPNIIFLILIFGVVASIGVSGGSINTTGALLTRWFRRKRATALGISTMGASVGGLLLVPFTAYLIQATDWRTAYIVLGAIVLGLGCPIAYLLLRDDPKDMGLQPDGDEEPAAGSSHTTQATRARGPLEVDYWQESFRSPPFWQLSVAYFACGATTSVMSVHFIPNAEDKGMTPEVAALAFGLMAGLNVVGLLIATTLADKFPRKNLLGLTYAGRGLGYAMLLLVPDPWSIWVFASIVGFSWWATGPLTTSLAADVYGLKYLGTLSGLMFLGHQLGAAASIQFAGIMRDVTGSYDLPFAVAGSLLVVASFLSFSVREKRYSSKYLSAESAPALSVGIEPAV